MRATLGAVLVIASACAAEEPGAPTAATAPSAPPSAAVTASVSPPATAAPPARTTPPPSAAVNQAPVDFATAPPEHTGVMFAWKETDPNSTGHCQAGHYVGEYMCRLYIIRTDGDGAFDVSGTVDMLLEQSMDGELLRVRNGTFTSATLAAIPVMADIAGELDCAASMFEGQLLNGTFSVALGLDVPFTQGTFSGPLTGDYDPSTSTLTGSWNMSGELDGFPGSCMDGSWSAKWVE